jgi:hypothetical protein
MFKDWRILVIWAGVIVFAAWILWWASAGYPPDGPVCFDRASNDCPRFNVIVYTAWQTAEFARHWAALIAAVFIGVLAIFAARLWRTTQQLSSVTHDTRIQAERKSKKELRAYLSVEPLGVTEYFGQNCLVGHFQIRNTGKIPASSVSVYSTIQLDSDWGRKNFPIGSLQISSTVVQPGSAMEFASGDGWPIPADQLDGNEPLKLKGYLYVWGEVLYTDEFNTVGWTAFCHRYPCEMFGVSEHKDITNSSAYNRSIARTFARYHEQGGNDAG